MKPPFIDQFERFQQDFSRRTFLQKSFAGIGGMALSQLLGASNKLPFLESQGGLHFPARAKRIVHLCMAGGPSHLESFDPKPKLDALNGQSFPDSFTAGQQLAQLQGSKLIARGDVYWVNLDPTIGTEIQKTRPALIVSPDDMNNALPRVIIAPLTSAGQPMGCRPEVVFQRKSARILLDQLRCVDKARLGKRMGRLDNQAWHPVLLEMLA